MRDFAALPMLGGGSVGLGMKVAVVGGPIRRWLVGDPSIQVVEVLAGATLDHLAAGEHLAAKGEVLVDAEAAAAIGELVEVAGWRAAPDRAARFAVVAGLRSPVARAPWPAGATLSDEQARPWLIPVVYQRLVSGRGDFLAELRPLAALFLSFDGIDYDHDPDAFARLDGYVRWLQSILTRYEGTLVQLTMGDKGNYLYVAFGAPVAHGDDPLRAAGAALELRAPPPEFDYIRHVKIGVTTGRGYTGSYGGSTRRTYGVLGDAVNLAARLMQAATPGEVLLTGSLGARVDRRFTIEPLAPIRVKGKGAPVPICRLIGIDEERSIYLSEPQYALPMVGRQAELAQAAPGSRRRGLGAAR